MGMTLMAGLALAEDRVHLTIPNTLGVQLKAWNYDAENLDRIAEAGFTWVRRGFIWREVEREKGVYDFSAYDRLLQNCEDRGLRILGCIASNNPLYAPVHEEEGREAFARFAAVVAERYKGRGILWEIWNEPNIATFWGRHGTHNSPLYAEQYAALVKATVPMMKAADPASFVMAGSVSGVWSASKAWMNHIFKQGVLDTGIDAWSVHPYTARIPEGHLPDYGWVRRSMALHGGVTDMPMINSERGFPLRSVVGGDEHIMVQGAGDGESAPHYQAARFVRQYLLDLLSDIRVSIWYEWTGRASEHGDGSFALWDEGPTPGYEACRAMVNLLRGYRLEGRLPVGSGEDFALHFVNDAGGRMLAVWTIRHEETNLRVEGVERLDSHDLYGVATARNAEAGVVGITISGAPQYIALPADLAQRLAKNDFSALEIVAKEAVIEPLHGGVIETRAIEVNADGWQFGLGQEFPGAKGSLDEVDSEGTKVLRVSGDFRSGGAYVDIMRRFKDPDILAVHAVRIRMKSNNVESFTLRFGDATGQTHQRRLTPLTPDNAWWTVDLRPVKLAGGEHWGGTNDGKWHDPVSYMAISLTKNSTESFTPEVFIGGLELVIERKP